MANHRDGGCDPTELPLTIQPANTARRVETTKPILPQPAMCAGFAVSFKVGVVLTPFIAHHSKCRFVRGRHTE